MQVDIDELKSKGFLKQVQEGRFSLRIKVVGGQVTAKQLAHLGQLAETFGNGYVHLTSRQSVEVPFIQQEKIEQVCEFLAQHDLAPASTGPKVRTITACQGKSVCRSGLIDTSQLAKAFDQRYGGRPVPHKFKIGITGCRNNCLKAEENDIGVKGAMVPTWSGKGCTYCGICQKTCPHSAIAVDREAKQLSIEKSRCLNCGRCIKSCPHHSLEGESGFVLFFGGLYGNRIAIGKQLLPVIHSTEEVFDVIEKTLQFFALHGKKGERFCTLLDRMGWASFQEALEPVRKIN